MSGFLKEKTQWERILKKSPDEVPGSEGIATLMVIESCVVRDRITFIAQEGYHRGFYKSVDEVIQNVDDIIDTARELVTWDDLANRSKVLFPQEEALIAATTKEIDTIWQSYADPDLVEPVKASDLLKSEDCAMELGKCWNRVFEKVLDLPGFFTFFRAEVVWEHHHPKVQLTNT